MAASQEELDELVKKLDEVEKKIDEGEAKQEEALKKFEEECQKEMKEKLESYGQGLQCNVDMSFNNLEKRMGEQTYEDIKTQQTEIFRLNRIIKDASKGIAKDWRNVFLHVMAASDVPQEAIDRSMKTIQRQKPSLQAFRALTIWKESGEEIDIDKLTEALRKYDKNELADHVDAILLADAAEILTFKPLPASAISKASEESDGAKAAFVDPLPDSKLLAMSKKIGPAWLDLAKKLNLSEIDKEDIKNFSGLTYQGAYRTLFLWRDMTEDQDIDQCEVLTEALNACNMSDVAELLK